MQLAIAKKAVEKAGEKALAHARAALLRLIVAAVEGLVAAADILGRSDGHGFQGRAREHAVLGNSHGDGGKSENVDEVHFG